MDKFAVPTSSRAIETARRVSRGGASDVSNVSFKRLPAVRGSVDAPGDASKVTLFRITVRAARGC
jgi:hypothetical protein